MVFSEIVDAADHLSPDEQLVLLEILQRRLAEHNRQLLVQEVVDAREAFAKGECKSATVGQIMDEIQP